MKPMKDSLGVSPRKGNKGTTRGKEKINFRVNSLFYGVDRICHCKIYFSMAKLTFPGQNFFMPKLTFPQQNFIKGLGRDLFLNKIKMAMAYSDNEDGIKDNTEEVLIK